MSSVPSTCRSQVGSTDPLVQCTSLTVCKPSKLVFKLVFVVLKDTVKVTALYPEYKKALKGLIFRPFSRSLFFISDFSRAASYD